MTAGFGHPESAPAVPGHPQPCRGWGNIRSPTCGPMQAPMMPGGFLRPSLALEDLRRLVLAGFDQGLLLSMCAGRPRPTPAM